MRTIVAGQTVFSGSEFAELALGVDPELFTGVEGETASERAARLDVARDVLADLRREAPELAEYAANLLDESAEVIELPTRSTVEGRCAA